MREAMYGWMTRWLKGEGSGKPIPEPSHTVESVADLACYPEGKRPASFVFPPTFAAREARRLLEPFRAGKPDHKEAWEAAAMTMRARLRTEVFDDFPKLPRPDARVTKTETKDAVNTSSLLLHPEPDMPVPVLIRSRKGLEGRTSACVLLHLDGKDAALKHPFAAALVDGGWAVHAPDLRATGSTRPEHDAILDAPDHNSAEHALWVGRPLLGQWVFDVRCLLDWILHQPGSNPERVAVVGISQAGPVALCAAGLLDDRVASAAALDAPVTYITEAAYAPGTHMGLLAPGILRVGDIPQLAALSAPRRLLLAGGVTPQGRKLTGKQLREAYAYTERIYRLTGAADRLRLRDEGAAADLAALL
jgi:pimeloyl-ACP methyl ester carboxylesterase